jgi:hypothetical protein
MLRIYKGQNGSVEARDMAKAIEKVITDSIVLRPTNGKFKLPLVGKSRFVTRKSKLWLHLAICESHLRSPQIRKHRLWPMVAGLAISLSGIYRHVPFKASYSTCFTSIVAPYKGALPHQKLKSLGVIAGKLLARVYRRANPKGITNALGTNPFAARMPILLTSGPWKRPSVLSGWYTSATVWRSIEKYVDLLCSHHAVTEKTFPP